MSTVNVVNVVFVGSNPSSSSPDSSPFHVSVRSRKTLESWIENLNANFTFINVCDDKTEGNKPLSVAQIREARDSLIAKLAQHPDAKMVSLGKTAARALAEAGVSVFLALPHPSGMNRKLNDPDTVRNTKESLTKYINEGII
jgi:uracil-DNA glycosylase